LICLGWANPAKVSSQRAINGIAFSTGMSGAIDSLQFAIIIKITRKFKHYYQDILQKSPPSVVNLSNFIHVRITFIPGYSFAN
jgi:hypothetical protein